MSKPAVIIGGVDYTSYVEELKLTVNGLNADGSGRDIQTGLMSRVKITDKWKVEVKLLPIDEDVMNTLKETLKKTSYSATTGEASGTFYTDSIPFGSARWNKRQNKTYYEGVAFSMTEM